MPKIRSISQPRSFVSSISRTCQPLYFLLLIFVFDLVSGSQSVSNVKLRPPREAGIRRARIKIHPRNEHAATSRFPFRPRNTCPRCRELPTPGRSKLLSRRFYSAILATFQRRTFSHSWPNRPGPFRGGNIKLSD